MQNMITSPASAAAVTALLSMRHSYMDRRIPEPQEYCTTPALDLCIRRVDRTPPSSPDPNAFQPIHTTPTPPPSLFSSINSVSHLESDSSMSSEHSTGQFPSIVPTPCPQPKAAPRLKATRPFKAYPKDPLVLAMGMTTSEAYLGEECTTEAYNEFRNKMLSQVKGTHGVTNKNMRRSSLPTNLPEDPSKNEAYWEKRRKNNEAAKRSRDARRAKEDEIAIRAAYLEHENLRLKYEVAHLRKETDKLRLIVYKN